MGLDHRAGPYENLRVGYHKSSSKWPSAEKYGWETLVQPKTFTHNGSVCVWKRHRLWNGS